MGLNFTMCLYHSRIVFNRTNKSAPIDWIDKGWCPSPASHGGRLMVRLVRANASNSVGLLSNSPVLIYLEVRIRFVGNASKKN